MFLQGPCWNSRDESGQPGVGGAHTRELGPLSPALSGVVCSAALPAGQRPLQKGIVAGQTKCNRCSLSRRTFVLEV